MIRRNAFAAPLVVAVVSRAASGQVPTDSAARWVDSILAPYASARSPGCAVGVTRDGNLTFQKSYGMADVAHAVAIGPDTRFYVASLSKQFTAMAIVLLAQDGKLSLQDTIQQWVPEVPSFGKPITLENLLHHTSGLRDYMTLLGVTGWSTDGELSERQFLDMVHRQKTLNFAPGDEFLYSNTGYALLGVVVRRASGQSLRDFAAERIFGPLGMTHTEFRDDYRRPIPDRAIGYETEGSGVHETTPRIDVVGDAGVFTTILDLAKWDANFENPRVGGAAGVAMLTEAGHLNDGQSIPYGLALALGELRGMKTVGHSGAFGGYRSEYLRFPEVGVGVMTLCNTSTAPTTLAEQIGTLMLGVIPRRAATAALTFGATPTAELYSSGTITSPEEVAEAARRRNDQLAQMAGSYYSDELDLAVTLVSRDGGLYLRRPKAVDIRFGSFATDLFISSDKMLLRVVRDSKGAVSGFTLTVNRVRDLEFTRQPARNK